MTLGDIYLNLGKYDKALGCFEKVVYFKPSYAEAYASLGRVYKQKGDKQKVSKQIKKLEALHREDLAAELKEYIGQ